MTFHSGRGATTVEISYSQFQPLSNYKSSSEMPRRKTAVLSWRADRRGIFDKVTWREPLGRRDEYGATGVPWYCSEPKKGSVYAENGWRIIVAGYEP
jgi:hypothetical protein